MKNEQIHDFLRETYSVFKKYNSRRPLNDEDLKESYTQFSAITAKYGIYDEDGTALNGWTYDFIFHGLLRELAKKEAND